MKEKTYQELAEEYADSWFEKEEEEQTCNIEDMYCSDDDVDWWEDEN